VTETQAIIISVTSLVISLTSILVNIFLIKECIKIEDSLDMCLDVCSRMQIKEHEPC
jgi:hypothetical protein